MIKKPIVVKALASKSQFMFGTEAMKIHVSIVTSVFTVQKVHTILLMSVMSKCSDLLFTMLVYSKQKLSPLSNCAAFFT